MIDHRTGHLLQDVLRYGNRTGTAQVHNYPPGLTNWDDMRVFRNSCILLLLLPMVVLVLIFSTEDSVFCNCPKQVCESLEGACRHINAVAFAAKALVLQLADSEKASELSSFPVSLSPLLRKLLRGHG